MRMYKKLVICALALCLPLAARALPIPAEPWDPTDATDELNLFEIYNTVYGTSLTSNVGLEAFAISSADLAVILSGGANLDAIARYAEFGQSIGYYNAGGDSAAVPVIGFGLDATGNLAIPVGTLGLFDQVSGGINARWYSNAALNMNSEDHMVAYRGQNNDVFIGFTDYEFRNPLVDFDYNDLVITLGGNAIVPEPASLLLVGMGVAGMFYRRLRK